MDLDERLSAAWRELQAISELPEDAFWAGYLEIETQTFDGLDGDDRNAAIEALNAFVAKLAKTDTQGYV